MSNVSSKTEGGINKEDNLKFIAIAVALFFIVLSFIGPHGEVFTKGMSSTLFLICAALILWITMAIPILASSLLIIALMPLIGIKPSLVAALGGFTSSATYFVIASMALGMVITRTSLPTKLLMALLNWSKGKVSKILLAFLLLSFIISMWVSDVGAVILALSFVTSFIELVDKSNKSGKNLVAVLALSAPIGAVLGGSACVVGASNNIVTLNMLGNYAHRTVTFVEWLIIGLPACFVTLIILWRVLLVIFKSDDLTETQTQSFVQKLSGHKSSLQHEGIAIGMMLLIMFTWVASSWIRWLDVTVVGIIGMALFFIPRYGALTWPDFKKEMTWEIPFMGACAVALGEAVRDMGLATLLSSGLAQAFPNIGPFALVILFATVITILLLGIPVGPAMAAMMTVPAYTLAVAVGVNPMTIVMVVGLFVANSSILPLNAAFLIPFSRGMFSVKDCARMGVFMSIIWIIIAAIWLPISTGFLYPMP